MCCPRHGRTGLFGIRTPWTLSNDRVWQRTHRVGGYLLVACGLIIVVGPRILPPEIGFPILLVAALGAAFGSVIFSYFAWRQETSSRKVSP